MGKNGNRIKAKEALVESLSRRREIKIEIEVLQERLNNLEYEITDTIIHSAETGLNEEFINLLLVDWKVLEAELLK